MKKRIFIVVRQCGLLDWCEEDNRDAETCLALIAPRANTESRKDTTGSSDCRLETRDYAFSYPRYEARADWRVREGAYNVRIIQSETPSDESQQERQS